MHGQSIEARKIRSHKAKPEKSPEYVSYHYLEDQAITLFLRISYRVVVKSDDDPWKIDEKKKSRHGVPHKIVYDRQGKSKEPAWEDKKVAQSYDSEPRQMKQHQKALDSLEDSVSLTAGKNDAARGEDGMSVSIRRKKGRDRNESVRHSVRHSVRQSIKQLPNFDIADRLRDGSSPMTIPVGDSTEKFSPKRRFSFDNSGIVKSPSTGTDVTASPTGSVTSGVRRRSFDSSFDQTQSRRVPARYDRDT
jgi:hypothetical protein